MKGFGKKTQQDVIKLNVFYQEKQRNYLCAQVEQAADDIERLLVNWFDIKEIKITDSFARNNLSNFSLAEFAQFQITRRVTEPKRGKQIRE